MLYIIDAVFSDDTLANITPISKNAKFENNSLCFLQSNERSIAKSLGVKAKPFSLFSSKQ